MEKEFSVPLKLNMQRAMRELFNLMVVITNLFFNAGSNQMQSDMEIRVFGLSIAPMTSDPTVSSSLALNLRIVNAKKVMFDDIIF
jgi:hypothetical protein